MGLRYQIERSREAIAEWSKALNLTGDGEAAALLERTFAASGFESAIRASAQKKLEGLMASTKGGRFVPAAHYVTAYMRLGDKEQAFVWMEKAVAERNRWALEFKVNPMFDSLRSDPRFEELVARVGIRTE